ncbi:N-acetylmuramic acid 6-phosphate etherase [Pirellula sp. SH-Sr6A]|uniref:N-acetylmuramic acid 6-phosphate etherase n=1 Tax=Pirellula sp. SH-Sr6A TaxID=1632865 RepID=UPI00078DF893|nr:N-acetylmuramic acid 6-phosphate etherase [Pirellula sp. SH-Sr6A]AMV31129.1 N-acetylmuramic acid 6-phosphate etherase [Pirellula sp. SH-Sr6A]
MEIGHLTTEQTNPASIAIDTLSSLEIVQLMNQEDRRCAEAVEKESAAIAKAVDLIADRMKRGGRLFYIGAGTSGRLGVLDASECPPTFNTRPEQVVGIIAGGSTALTTAVEGAEDDENAAAADLQKHHFDSGDVLVGIATSGRTPYVVGGLQYARSLGAICIGFTCNPESALERHCDFVIAPVVGPEVISGSTRLKSGTATKMVLNMLTTGTMIRLGKTYGNWMVDLRATNIKLKARSIRIVSALTQLDSHAASILLDRCNGEVKVAIVASQCNAPPDRARELLRQADGSLRRALQLGSSESANP